MATIRTIRERELLGSWDSLRVKPRLNLYLIFDNFTCYKEDEHCMTAAEEGGVVPLPFSCAFSQQAPSQHIAAVANEDGKVHLIDTLASKNSCIKTWQAHVNAVFDIAWVNHENKLVTGSGDQTAQLWDVETTKCISVFKGHTCSLRSISFKRNHSNVFATGARDGNIMIWDTRTRPMKSGYFKPVNILHGVHTVSGGAATRRSSSVRNEAQQSVTTVLFKDEHHLYSSGAADGTIKMWDVRRYYTTVKGIPQAKHVYPYVGTATRKNGISCLSLTSCGSYLFSSCTDDNIYMYDTHSDTKDPVSVFNGHTNSTFYVKNSVTQDDEYLVSGSSSHSVYVWDIKHPTIPPITLDGHAGEVTSVACSTADIGRIVSCSDDNTVRVWRLHDQLSLCKEGQKCGVSSRLQNHSPTLMTSLNLHHREPASPGHTPTRATVQKTPTSSRSKKKTPSRGQNPLPGQTPTRKRSTPKRTILTPTRKLSTPTRNALSVEGRRLGTIVEDNQVPCSSSQEDKHTLLRADLTPNSSPRNSPRRQSPRTPGKISSYFKSNGMLSSEKNKTADSPIRQSPRLSKLVLSQSLHQVSSLVLNNTSQPLNHKPSSSPIKPPRSPIKSPRSLKPAPATGRTPKKEQTSGSSTTARLTPKKKHFPSQTPKKTQPPSSIQTLKKSHKVVPVETPKKAQDPTPIQTPNKILGASKTRVEDKKTTCSRMRLDPPCANRTTTVGTQTLSPIECTSSCKGCCRNYTPLYAAAIRTRTPNIISGGNTRTPPTDLTPRSCSNSSVPRRTRIHHPDPGDIHHPDPGDIHHPGPGDIPTTPTKGTTLILKQSTSHSPVDTTGHKIRRKFTRTGTPIHHNNCRCSFCRSSATELSELSNSPILEMPGRPRKRPVNHDQTENSPKRRKSLFSLSQGHEEETHETLSSCSPYSQGKENVSRQNGYRTPEKGARKRGGTPEKGAGKRGSPEKGTGKRVTVTGWLEHKITEQEEEEEEEKDKTHDHSQCSSLHCIRSYFTRK